MSGGAWKSLVGGGADSAVRYNSTWKNLEVMWVYDASAPIDPNDFEAGFGVWKKVGDWSTPSGVPSLSTVDRESNGEFTNNLSRVTATWGQNNDYSVEVSFEVSSDGSTGWTILTSGGGVAGVTSWTSGYDWNTDDYLGYYIRGRARLFNPLPNDSKYGPWSSYINGTTTFQY